MPRHLGSLVVKTTAGRRAGARRRCGRRAQPGTEPVYTTVTANGVPSVLINIARQPTSNTVHVADGVAAEIAQLQRRCRPACTSTPFYDQSELVRESIKSVRDAIFIGLVLACIILFLFLRDWSSSLVAGMVIPVTVAVTILFLWVIGESFNLMTLGGLAAAIGLVIDDAIVVVENIVVHRDARRDARQRGAAGAARDRHAADLLHHHAGRRLSSADRRYRRHGQLLPRAGHYHDGCVADVAGPAPSALRRRCRSLCCAAKLRGREGAFRRMPKRRVMRRILAAHEQGPELGAAAAAGHAAVVRRAGGRYVVRLQQRWAATCSQRWMRAPSSSTT